MYFEVLLDVTAIIPPLVAILFLVRQKGSTVGLAKNNLIRLCFYFIALVGFDSLSDLGVAWAVYGVLLCLGLVILSFGHVVVVINYCPEVRTLKDSIRPILKKTWPNTAYYIFNLIGIGWMVMSVVTPIGVSSSYFNGTGVATPTFPAWYQTATIIMMIPLVVYPSLLLLLAVNRAKIPNVKHSLLTLLWGWLFLPISLVFALIQTAPIPGLMTQAGLLISSSFFVLCAVSIRNNYGITRVLTSQLAPQPVLKSGHRYLVLHDGGKGLISFLSASLQSIIESGGRVIINNRSLSRVNTLNPSPSSLRLIEALKRSQPRFDGWVRTGKVVTSIDAESPRTRESLSERLSQGPSQLAFVKELDTEDLRTEVPEETLPEKSQFSSDLFLLESSKAPRPLLSEFLDRNREMEVLNVSETRDTFSNMLNQSHIRIQGSRILLEYDSAVNLEEIVSKFFKEGSSNAELCALFTTKSSKLYRSLKGNSMIKMVAASSLVSSMDELPDGEVQIPDHELGLVTSIASDLLENNKFANASIVFDTIPELIMGDTWEQVYSGIKQLFELVSVPSATAIFLGNRDTMDPRLLAAIRSFFTIQLRLDATGLHIVKLKRL